MKFGLGTCLLGLLVLAQLGCAPIYFGDPWNRSHQRHGDRHHRHDRIDQHQRSDHDDRDRNRRRGGRGRGDRAHFQSQLDDFFQHQLAQR